MREIKFRVWSESRKKWLNECMFDMEVKGAYDFSSDASMRYNYKTDVIVEQFTGLTDKNGVEIYEGDVIEFSSHWDKHVCAVSFNKCKFGFGREIKGDLGINDDCDLFSFMSGSGCNSYTVIGNIHQNPELLEQNDD